MGKLHLNITVTGKVQGVGFRYFASHRAKLLGITGFITNQPEGTVYLEVEGERGVINQFLAWCHHGPKTASVTKVSSFETPLKNFTSFSIKK